MRVVRLIECTDNGALPKNLGHGGAAGASTPPRARGFQQPLTTIIVTTAITNSPAGGEAGEKEFSKKLRPFLADTRGAGDRSFDLAKARGHVWLFIRK